MADRMYWEAAQVHIDDELDFGGDSAFSSDEESLCPEPGLGGLEVGGGLMRMRSWAWMRQ